MYSYWTFRVRQESFLYLHKDPSVFWYNVKNMKPAFWDLWDLFFLDFDQDLASLLSLSCSILILLPAFSLQQGALFWKEALGVEFWEFIGAKLPQPPQSLLGTLCTLPVSPVPSVPVAILEFCSQVHHTLPHFFLLLTHADTVQVLWLLICPCLLSFGGSWGYFIIKALLWMSVGFSFAF